MLVPSLCPPAARVPRWTGLWQPRRGKNSLYGPRRPRGPPPRSPATVKGPAPGERLPWYLRKPLPVREQLPELNAVTSERRLFHVPWLAKPTFPKWERGWHDPRHYKGPRVEEMPDYQQRPCFVVHKRTRMQEDVKQALWLTKTKLIEELPPQIVNIMNDPAHQLEDQDEKVQDSISRAYLHLSTEDEIPKEVSCSVLVEDLLHLCRLKTVKYPTLAKRLMAHDYRVAAAWERESILLQIRGINGKLLNAMNPLQPIASREEMLATENHTLETFYPIAPTIDLQETNVYQIKNDTGFQRGYPYPHPHTIYFVAYDKIVIQPKYMRAKMIMFAFGNALAKAKELYGDEPRVLDKPIVVQSIGTDGQCFQFLVFQLNTTDLDSSNGVKNLAWMDADQFLYEHARRVPLMSRTNRKIVEVPAGIHGYQPDTFKKFLALYLNGAV